MREDTMALIEQAQTNLKQVERLISEEDWTSGRNVHRGYNHGVRTTNVVAAIDALGKAWVTEATAQPSDD